VAGIEKIVRSVVCVDCGAAVTIEGMFDICDACWADRVRVNLPVLGIKLPADLL